MSPEFVFMQGRIAGVFEAIDMIKWWAPVLFGIGVCVGVAIGAALRGRS